VPVNKRESCLTCNRALPLFMGLGVDPPSRSGVCVLVVVVEPAFGLNVWFGALMRYISRCVGSEVRGSHATGTLTNPQDRPRTTKS
jgi:hypothetical protein